MVVVGVCDSSPALRSVFRSIALLLHIIQCGQLSSCAVQYIDNHFNCPIYPFLPLCPLLLLDRPHPGKLDFEKLLTLANLPSIYLTTTHQQQLTDSPVCLLSGPSINRTMSLFYHFSAVLDIYTLLFYSAKWD